MATLDELEEKRATLVEQLKHKESEHKKYQVKGKGRGAYAASQRGWAAQLSGEANEIKAEIAAVDKEIAEKSGER